MYRLLIVDDEHQIVDWLYELFRSMHHLDLDICKAYSGSEALEYLSSTKVDIVISDICMPGMDGLQLAKKIYESWPFCKVIFLTGYNEFDYIYKAVKNDCVSYLLKNEDDEEVVKVVEKSVKELDKSYKDMELIDKAKQQMHMAVPLMQKEYMQDVFLESGFEPEISQEKFSEMNLPLDANAPVLVIMGVMDDLFDKIKTSSKLTESIYAIKLIYEKHFFDFPGKLFIEYCKGCFVILLQAEQSKTCFFTEYEDFEQHKNMHILAKGRLETIQSICRESLDLTISFIIGSNFITWENVAEKAAYFKQLLDHCTGSGREILITEGNFPQSLKEKTEVYDEALKKAISKLKKVDSLEAYLEHGQKKEFFDLLENLLECLKSIKSKSYGPALEIYYSVSTCLLSFINKWMLAEKITFRIGLNKLTQAHEHPTWNDAVQYIYQLCEIIFDIKKNDKNKIETDSITIIQRYVEDHLHEDLSLARLSEMVYFNPSYFSRLFKQTTGKNLTEYIQDSRIMKAKKLLLETNTKIQDIAAAVGSDSSTYFGYYFKKAMGMSPNEYRDMFALKNIKEY